MVNRGTDETYEPMDFGGALAALKRGERAARSGWNGRGQSLRLQRPDAHSLMSLPYLYIVTVGGELVPWVASQTDLLAEDWSTWPVEV